MHPAARRHPFAALLGAFIGVGLGTAAKARCTRASTAVLRRL